MLKVDVKGIDKLVSKLGRIQAMKEVRQIVRENGVGLQRKMSANAQFKGKYTIGTTRRSIPIGSGFRNGGLEAFAGPTTDYAPYVEYGTRKMSAQPFVKPAFIDQKEQFKQDMERLVK